MSRHGRRRRASGTGRISSRARRAIVTKTGHPTNVVFALDLTLVVPTLVVGAVWLWRRAPLGFVLAAVLNVKGALYMLSLCAATGTAWRAGTLDGLGEVGLWGAIGVGCAAAAVATLRGVEEK